MYHHHYLQRADIGIPHVEIGIISKNNGKLPIDVYKRQGYLSLSNNPKITGSVVLSNDKDTCGFHIRVNKMCIRDRIVFPVEDEKIKKELEHVLDLEFKDNVKACLLYTSRCV